MNKRLYLILAIFSLSAIGATNNIYYYQTSIIDKKINIKSSSEDNSEITNPLYDCFSAANVGQVGLDGECNGKIIVDNDILRNIVINNQDYSHNTIWTGQVTNLQNLFNRLNYTGAIQDISGWNVSNVTNMSGLFFGKTLGSNISSWNVSNVNNMSNMFGEANFNGNISGWNVSNVNNMSNMFERSGFNVNISEWNVGNVSNMSYMFAETGYNQNISSWNVSNVSNMSGMFYAAYSFNQNLSGWCVINISSKPSQFDQFSAYTNPALHPQWGTCP